MEFSILMLTLIEQDLTTILSYILSLKMMIGTNFHRFQNICQSTQSAKQTILKMLNVIVVVQIR